MEPVRASKGSTPICNEICNLRGLCTILPIPKSPELCFLEEVERHLEATDSAK